MNIGPKRKPCRVPPNFLNRPCLRWGWVIFFFYCYPSLGESQKRTVQSLWQLSEVLDFTQPQRLFEVFKNRHYSTPHTPISVKSQPQNLFVVIKNRHYSTSHTPISVPPRFAQPRRLFHVIKNGHYSTPHATHRSS